MSDYLSRIDELDRQREQIDGVLIKLLEMRSNCNEMELEHYRALNIAPLRANKSSQTQELARLIVLQKIL